MFFFILENEHIFNDSLIRNTLRKLLDASVWYIHHNLVVM